MDAPDWILAEVSVLSKMSSVRIKLICRQVLHNLRGNEFDYQKLHRLTTSDRIAFSAAEKKAMIAAIRFIFNSSAKFDVATDVLPLELQQLGLPGDIVTAMCREFNKEKESLQAHLSTQTLQLPRVTKADWRVDYVMSSSALREVNSPTVRMNLHLSKATDKTKATLLPPPTASSSSSSASASVVQLPFEMSADQFKVLYNDLKLARKMMEKIS